MLNNVSDTNQLLQTTGIELTPLESGPDLKPSTLSTRLSAGYSRNQYIQLIFEIKVQVFSKYSKTKISINSYGIKHVFDS